MQTFAAQFDVNEKVLAQGVRFYSLNKKLLRKNNAILK